MKKKKEKPITVQDLKDAIKLAEKEKKEWEKFLEEANKRLEYLDKLKSIAVKGSGEKLRK